MRIISGKYKGRRITAPKKLPVRPTTDLSKESLSNILNNSYHFSALTVLDLFSGTGNISYEFGSRGAQHITAVDGHYGCVKFITQTAADFELPIQAIKSDVYSFLERAGGTYDIIFADPPYGFEADKFEKIAQLVFQHKLLNPGGTLIIEHSKHTPLDHLPELTNSRKYGGSIFSFFTNEEAGDEEE